MKKKIISMLLLICMLFQFIPATVFALENETSLKEINQGAIYNPDIVVDDEGDAFPIEHNITSSVSNSDVSIKFYENQVSTFGLRSEQTETVRYSILVLDTSDSSNFVDSSGSVFYTADTAISYVKTASKKFISDIQKASGTNYVAIVEYKGSNANIVSEFSTDYTALSSKIDSLYASGDTRSVSLGLETAYSLLEKITDDTAKKNVVLFTTGMTNECDYTYDGIYNEDTVGSKWRRLDTQIRLYAYANAGINQADKIKDTAMLYSVGLFQTMEEMPDEGADIVEFFKLFTSDVATSEEYFYDVKDPNNLEFVFGEIAEDIINPLNITLSHEYISLKYGEVVLDDNGTSENKLFYTYRIKASIKNNSNKTSINTKCSIDLIGEDVPYGFLAISNESIDKVIGNIDAGQEVSITWDVKILTPFNDTTVTYGVTAESDNSAPIRQVNIIYVEGVSAQDNTLIFGKDQWSFSNSPTFYGTNENYYLTEDDYEALVLNLSNTDKQKVDSGINSTWDGSCYGMAITTILNKVGIINPNDIQSRKNNLYDITKVNNDSVESFINFYSMTQHLSTVLQEINTFDSLSALEKIQTIETAMDDVTDDGYPMLVCFWLKPSGGHALVAYGHETGEWSFGGFLGIGAKKFNSRILIYDCNYPDDTEGSCIYYNSGSGECYIPNYKDSFSRLAFATNSLEILDIKNYSVETTNSQAIITSKNLTEYLLEYGGNQYTINSQTNDPETGLRVQFGFTSINADNLMRLLLPYNDISYKINTGDQNNIDISFNNNIYSYSFVADKAENIVFGNQNSASVSGIQGNYSATYVANDGFYKTPWYKTVISGSGTSKIELEPCDSGMVIFGDDLSQLTITTVGEGSEQTLNISTTEDSILLTTDKEEPVVMIDTNNDGIHDTKLTQSNSDDNSNDDNNSFDYDYWYWTLMMLYNQEYKITASATEGGTITPAGISKVKYDKNITYTITPDEGYSISDVIVDGKSVGAVSEYTIKNIKAGHTIKAIFEKTAWENPYTDVSKNAWYYEDIEFVSENGLMIGTGDNKFSPNDIVNRAMLVTVLWRLENSPIIDSTVDFSDIPADEWYTAAVNWAAANGIVNGYGNGKFGAMNDLTHEQIMAILNRYAVYKKLSENVSGNADDSYTNSKWAENNVLWADRNDMFDGIGSDISNLTEGADRAELAAYLRRFCEKFMAK